MPYKHHVIDSRGNVHTRTSQNRAYPFAIVKHFANRILQDGRVWPEHSSCSWSSRRELAEKEAYKYKFGEYGFEAAEIIPCTPVATGKHAKAEVA